MSDFPFIVSGNFATYKGNFFVNRGDHWRKIEKYLPGAPGTLGEPIETTAHKWLKRLNDGEQTKQALCSGGMPESNKYYLTEQGIKTAFNGPKKGDPE